MEKAGFLVEFGFEPMEENETLSPSYKRPQLGLGELFPRNSGMVIMVGKNKSPNTLLEIDEIELSNTSRKMLKKRPCTHFKLQVLVGLGFNGARAIFGKTAPLQVLVCCCQI
ncbi:hypothetical protein AVEN_27992-1 [Araneus ventricosus]|uniref:Uncharacterized protein n=1 Tax=Araneus ventricosus TaxID=182803 RepID=A0A4Y2BHK9_ARAVE|nr:hypothetical protein AVEN_27992-1 [Araneus ventricosus]